MPTYTTNFDLAKPLVGSATDQDLWGDELNDDLDTIDTEMYIGQRFVTTAKTANYTATTADKKKLILCDATGGAFTVTLMPAATAGDGFTMAIKKTDASANAVTVDGDGSETIDGDTTLALEGENDSIMIVSNGSNWFTVSREPQVTIPDASTTTKGIIEIATNAEVATGTDTDRAVVPSAMRSHNGVFKAWVVYNGSSNTVLDSYNVSGVSRSSTGTYVATLSSAAPDTNFGISLCAGGIGSSSPNFQVTARTTSTVTVETRGYDVLMNATYVFIGWVWTE